MRGGLVVRVRAGVAAVAVMLIAASLVVVGPGGGPVESAAAANSGGFDPGNIIDDALFWDGTAMNETEVQDFLNAKVPTCRAGYVCLKDYREDTRTIPATPMCGRYEGRSSETAAQIIARVGQLCGVSPRVILVTLQKEQGLVTSSAPSAYAYRSAMGAGCPDTAACDSAYYGFFNQVHYGAFLLKRYTQPPGTGAGTDWPTRFDRRYPVGETSSVLLSPYGSCGARDVFIANQATHALYLYTPYTPNAAALAAGYGIGDDCSTYGNRNFYLYFSDWFGSVRGFSVEGAIRARYEALGGSGSYLGEPIGRSQCGLARGGCYQKFESGYIFDRGDGFALDVSDSIRPGWGPAFEWGPMGYPQSGTMCGLAQGGCYQVFDGGLVYWGPVTGAQAVTGAIGAGYAAENSEWGTNGFPTGPSVCGLAGGGCYQPFQGGLIFQRPDGAAVTVRPVVRPGWAPDFEWGRLGYPASPATCESAGCVQKFDGGAVITSGFGAIPVSASVAQAFERVGGRSGATGVPTGREQCGLARGGCYQVFERAQVFTSAAGSYAVRPEVRALWARYDLEWGSLGYPTSDPSAGSSYRQNFEGGTVEVTNGSARLVWSNDPWVGAVERNGWLGAATTNRVCGLANGGCYRAFTNGYLYSSPAGVFAVRPDVRSVWASADLEWGALGYPISDPSATGGTYTQTFQGGTISVLNGVGAITSASDPWLAAQVGNPWLGRPLTARMCGLVADGCYRAFENGYLYSSSAGVYAVRPEVRALWARYDLEWGALGYPTTNPSESGSNYSQAFQGGVVIVEAGTARLSG